MIALQDVIFVPLTEDNDIAGDAQETQPLLSRAQQQQQQQQPNLGCTVGPHCKRCLAGAHNPTSTTTTLLRVLTTLILLYLIWNLRAWLHEMGFWIDSRCLAHLEPWNRGPLNISVGLAGNLEVSFEKGPISATVEVSTSEDVDAPIVFVEAWVTENFPQDGGEQSGVGESGSGDRKRERGLELEVNKTEDSTKLVFSTTDDKSPNRFPRPGYPFSKTFCAKVDIKIVFPAKLRTFGQLVVAGTTVAIHAHDISDIAFNSTYLTNTVGDILILPSSSSNTLTAALQTNKLLLITGTGSITLASVQPTPGHGLSLTCMSFTGPITFLALTDPLSKANNSNSNKTTTTTIEAQKVRYEVLLTTVMARVRGTIRPGAEIVALGGRAEEGRTPEMISVYIQSFTGHISTDVTLLPHQTAWVEMSSAIGTFESSITDNFLGSVRVEATVGFTTIKEAQNSSSKILYRNNTVSLKAGCKVLQSQDSCPVVNDPPQSVMLVRTRVGNPKVSFLSV